MRKIMLLSINLVLVFVLKAQHCRYDGERLIMIKVNYPGSLKDDFKIELLDSLGKPKTIKRYSGKADKYDTIPAVFWKNPPENTTRNYNDWKSEHFSFAKNYYILNKVPLAEKKLKARITYLGSKNKKYKPQVVSLPPDAVQPLCTANNPAIWAGKVPPVEVEFK